MKGLSRISPLLVCLAALAASHVSTNALAGTSEPVAVPQGGISSLNPVPPGNGQSLLTSAATSIVATNAGYPLWIVTCGDGVDTDALLEEYHLVPAIRYDALNGFAALLDAATIRNLKADARILFVEADGPVTLCDQTNSLGLVRMGIDHFPVAHINGTNEPLDVDVAVMDSGIYTNHPELKVYQTFNGVAGTDGNDYYGHGTAIAGIIAAQDNGSGVVGVAPGVRIWNIKVNNAQSGTWTDVGKGINYIFSHPNISVVNMSFANVNGIAPVATLKILIRSLVNSGVVVVAAAGNSTNDLAGPDGIYGTGDDVVPTAFPEAMAVSAMDPATDTLAFFSNFSQIARTNGYPNGYDGGGSNYVFSPGGAIDVAAPGVNILTTAAGGDYYAAQSGTSMAAPHVTGLVALYIAAHGRATNAEGVYRIRQAIVDSALAQSQWRTNNTHDPDTNPEPLAIASEIWVPRPAITNTAGAPGNFQVKFATIPGYDYTVQSAANLAPSAAWTNLATVSGSSNLAPASVTDPNAASQSFYRLKRTPSP